MASYEDIMAALRKADAAGNVEDARRLAQMAAAAKQPEMSTGAKVARGVDQFTGGFADSVLGSVAAIPELAASGLRAISPSLAPEPGYYDRGIKRVAQTVGDYMMPDTGVDLGPAEPQGRLEKILRGTGAGIGDAAAFVVPAAAAARYAQAGSIAQRTGQVAATQPGMQLAAGGVGGAVTEATDNPLYGMAAAVATPFAANVGRRIVSPVTNVLSAEERRIAGLAEQMGIRLTPGQATGSRPIQAAESALTTLPLSSGRQTRVYDAQRQGFNRAVLNTAGVNADNAAPQVLDDAFRAIGQQFDSLAAQTNVAADPQFFQGIDRAANEYARRLDTNVRPAFQSYVDDINQMRQAAQQPGVTRVSVDGRAYQNIASDLRTAARETKDENYARALRGLSEALDDALERTMGPQAREAWQDLRGRYRNLVTINKAMTGGGQSDRISGDIPFGGLTTAVRGMDKTGYARGRGDLNDVSRVGDFLANKIPNSGTPERQYMTGLLTGAPAVAGGGAAVASGASPTAAVLTALTGYSLPPLAQWLINSRGGQAYLRNQFLAGGVRDPGPLMLKILAAQTNGGVPVPE